MFLFSVILFISSDTLGSIKTIGQVLIETIPEAIHLILRENDLEIIEETEDETHFDRVSVIGFSASGFGGALGFAIE